MRHRSAVDGLPIRRMHLFQKVASEAMRPSMAK
jgi:hypothetical protein